jgi:hypothetical protein
MTAKDQRIQGLRGLADNWQVRTIYESTVSNCYAVGSLDFFVRQSGSIRVRQFNYLAQKEAWTLDFGKELQNEGVISMIRCLLEHEVDHQHKVPPSG